MDSGEPTLLALLDGSQRAALVGLAKNTGKTETLAALLRELAAQQITVGVTSVGRDGEVRDVIDARILKPRVRLEAGSLLATTGPMLRASGLDHERVAETGMRTPLGEVVIARLLQQGAVEVAGPGAAADVRAVCETMAAHGAQQVLIDGALDRRAASSPEVSDGLVMATGAVLDTDIERVVELTLDAVELVRLPPASPESVATPSEEADGSRLTLARALVLGAEPAQIAALLRERPRAETLRVEGSLSERFLEGLLEARRERAGRPLRIVVSDPTKVFLSRHGPGWYRRQGIAIEVLRGIELRAITINPLAPQSHRFESERMRELIQSAVGEVPVRDVLYGRQPVA